jgi:hypothetical protein
MPESAEFLHGFGLDQGMSANGYILKVSHATHKAIKRYQEYYYEITLVFSNLGQGNYNNLYYTVDNLISQEHIIYGVRNPYRCIIDPPKQGDIVQDNNDIIFNLVGHSYRT